MTLRPWQVEYICSKIDGEIRNLVQRWKWGKLPTRIDGIENSASRWKFEPAEIR